jgi:TIR domain/NACHT domain
VDELVRVLAAVVVKMAFRLWSGDKSPGTAGQADLADMIMSRVSGPLEQRRVRARFEGMGEIVADRIGTELATEFPVLGVQERDAVLVSVAETLDSAQLKDQVLFEADLDLMTLERLVRRDSAQITRSLSAGGTACYDFLLAQCCAYAIEVADKLPRFEAGAFTELLRREAQIMTLIEEVLARLPAPDDQARTERSERLETAYRQLVARALDRLDIFGLDFAAPAVPLSTAYVDLTLSGEQPAGSSGDSLEKRLASCPRLLIEGSAGSGKTTILQWIAVRAALRDFTGAATSLNGNIPFFLRLRAYADKRLPRPEEFLDGIAPMLAPEQPVSWSSGQLRSGRAFVLVDGVNEVPDHQRLEVVTWLRNLTATYPDVRYVVTARPGAVDPGELGDAGFTTAVVDPMDPARIRLFVDQWYAAAQWWQKDAGAVDELGIYCDTLLKTLDTHRFVRELASTPLLAGLVCVLNQDVRGRLPRRRSDILEAALRMFYERDRQRGIPAAFDFAAVSLLLGDLALWMLRNGSTVAPSDSARALLRRSALVFPGKPGSTVDLYDSLLRGGLLREPAAGQVTFLDRTIQEYLAANALIGADNIGELVRNANDDQWREVVILAAGQGTVRQATEILRGLLRPQRPGTLQYQRRLLAVRCLGEIRHADPDVLADIDRAIPELLPPRSLDQAEAFSDAGDEMIPYLARTIRVANVDQLPMVIRAASLISGPDAFDLIAAVAQMSRISIGTARPFADETPEIRALREELIRAAQYFDRDAYEEKVLTPLDIRLPPAPAGSHRVLRAQGLEPRRLARYMAAGGFSDQAENINGHAFLSYVREDSAKVAQLEALLTAAGIPVWRDTADIWPGDDWRVQIRRAITNNALVFVACFSRNSMTRAKAYQNEELVLAIEQLRLRSPDTPWLIPVRLDDCEIPERDIGDGRTLRSLHHADLFGQRYEEGTRRLIAAIGRILGGA